jgi:hypothetical protein
MFLSARNNQFKFEFPRTFIPNEIGNKYKKYITRIPGSIIKEPIDYFNHGIQSINLPGPSYDPVQQNDFPGNTRRYRASQPTQELYDKSLTVTFKAFDAYVNYWMALELYSYYYSLDGKHPHLPEGVGIQLIDSEGNILITVAPHQMIMSSISSLNLNFSSNTVEFQTFDIEFAYNILDINLNLI